MERLNPNYKPLKVKLDLSQMQLQTLYYLLSIRWQELLYQSENIEHDKIIYNRALQEWLYKQSLKYFSKIAEPKKKYRLNLKGTDVFFMYKVLITMPITGTYEQSIRDYIINTIIPVI